MKKYISTFLFISVAFLTLGVSCGTLGGDEEVQTSGPAGMFVTTDKGESWKNISKLPTADGVQSIENTSVYRIFEDPQDSKAMYWGSRKNGLFYSWNNGATWNRAGKPLNQGFVRSVAVHPNNKCLLYVTNGRRVFRSDDCLRTWEEVYRESRDSVDITSLQFHHNKPFDLYLAKNNGDFLVSRDAAESWTVLNRFNDASLEKILIGGGDSDSIYLSSRESGLFRSDDRGETWLGLRSALEEFAGALTYRRSLAHPKKAGKLYWISKYGILVSTDKGESWEALELITEPGSVDIYGFAINPNDDSQMYYTATADIKTGDSTFYFTNDGGQSWTTRELPTSQVPTAIRFNPENPNALYVGFTIPPSN